MLGVQVTVLAMDGEQEMQAQRGQGQPQQCPGQALQGSTTFNLCMKRVGHLDLGLAGVGQSIQGAASMLQVTRHMV